MHGAELPGGTILCVEPAHSNSKPNMGSSNNSSSNNRSGCGDRGGCNAWTCNAHVPTTQSLSTRAAGAQGATRDEKEEEEQVGPSSSLTTTAATAAATSRGGGGGQEDDDDLDAFFASL